MGWPLLSASSLQIGVAVLSLVLVAAAALLYLYVFAIPEVGDERLTSIAERVAEPLRASRLDHAVGSIAYGVAYVLSILRAPLGTVPYLCKLGLFFGFGVDYTTAASSRWFEAARVGGDVANLVGWWLLVARVVGPARPDPMAVVLYAMLAAEATRLTCES